MGGWVMERKRRTRRFEWATGWLGLGGWAGGGKREREGGRVGDVLFGESNGERQVFGRV